MAALLAYYLVLYLNLHACTARLLIMVSDRKYAADQLEFRSKDVETDDMALDNHRIFSVQQGQNGEGKKSQSRKILHQDTGAKIWKRAQRLMVESSMSKAEENVRAKAEENVRAKDSGTVEDIGVMDYAQPHRKPPIHNKGT